jgi:hypothetical protein
LVVFGLLLVIFGTIFALQGVNVIGGSSFMNGNRSWVYIGGALDVTGLILVVAGSVSRSKSSLAANTREATQ